MYTFINKNYLIPVVINSNTKLEALNELYYCTVSRSLEYNNNVYVICQNNNQIEFYYSNGLSIFSKNIYSNKEILIYNYEKINFQNNYYLLNIDNSLIDQKSPDQNIVPDLNSPNQNIVSDLNLTIKNKVNENVILNNDIQTNKLNIFNNPNISKNDICEQESINLKQEQKSINLKQEKKTNYVNTDDSFVNKNTTDSNTDKKKEELIKLIEQVNDLYHKELSNIKKLEMNIKSFDAKLNKLNKKKREDIINDIIKTQSEFQTWKKLKYIIDDDIDVLKPIDELELSNKKVPVLFLSKFDYIDKIYENDGIQKIFNEINLIDLNKLYSDNILPDDKIIQFCNKYVKLSKELHYNFDHEWDYLENEMNVNSTNKLS